MKKIKRIIVILIIVILLLSIFLLIFYNKKMKPRLMSIAKIKCKKIGIELISNNVMNSISKYLDSNNLFDIVKNDKGNIETIDYNSKVINEILSISSKVGINNLKELEKNKNGIVTYLPIGIASNNIFLEDKGPKIPIRLYLDGNVLTSLKTDIKEYGIDSALVEVSVRIEASVKVIIPFESEEINIVNEIPISIKIVKGNVSGLLQSKYN
ncbi:MAG: sporulation protein YunB [Bacilli bacterium]|nr:sporulation protein YunB [Bacilli bacterium]